MCFTVAIVRNNVVEVASKYYDRLPIVPHRRKDVPEFPDYHFVGAFVHPALPILKSDGVHLYNWGLIPSWTKDSAAANDIRTKTLNAMGETVFEKASFRNSIVSQRCILPISGFYEWQDVKGVKYPYYIYPSDGECFSVGAIYNSWTDSNNGITYNTFSMLTTVANPLMEEIHNLKKRMPLILSLENGLKWIDPTLPAPQIKDLIRPYDENGMKAHTISRKANNTRNNNNVQEIKEKVFYSELNMGTLF